MAKTIKTSTMLADNSGAVWVEAELTQTQVKRVINSYKRAGIDLTPYGSPDQVIKQVEKINSMLDSNEIARNMRESGRLVVMGVGY
jgi:hypothetical protein